MDIMVGHRNMQRIQRSIDARLCDARVDRDLREKLYVILHGRYYEHFPDDKLMARYAVLVRQLAYLLDDFRDIPPEHCGFISSWWWIGRLIDLQTEFRLRGYEPPPLPIDLAYIGEPCPLVLPERGDRTFIARYSEMAFMQDLITKGTLRLGPASALNDGSLDPARRDTEMSKPNFRDGKKMIVTSADGARMPVRGEMEFSTKLPNYYLSCWATEHDPRLFREFPNKARQPADACLIVWDVDEFARRISSAAGMPDRQFHCNPVEYYDAYNLEPGQHTTAGFSKEFFYAYQREYRFVWLSPQDGPLEPRFIHAGPMGDIATLLAADGSPVAGRPLP